MSGVGGERYRSDPMIGSNARTGPRRLRLVVRLTLIAAVAGVVVSCGPGPGPAGVTGDGGRIARVTRTTDGDTVHVLLDGRDDRVRLIGVDTPEVDWYGGEPECFGNDAALYTRRRLTGRDVLLRFDVTERDRYGRLLAYVWLGGESFNRTLVRLGYARADPVPPDTAMASVFAGAEQRARSERRGLWSACPA